MKNLLTFCLCVLVFTNVQAQETLVQNVAFTSIGPSIMSGRVTDLDVNPNNPTEFYVAYASGGLWHTNNNGTSFTPILDNAPSQNIGDIAVDWKNGTIWVGTGESNSSRSSYAGIGMLKSEDKGKTWQDMGLHDSHHIGGIIINPDNPQELIVGVIGHLYTKNEERGIFKTKDGGKTWQKTLFINDGTGIIDISMVPENFNIIYASAWERERKAWNFEGSGENSAIYKSIDGGDSWEKISTEKSGFPTGKGVGRIGVAAFDDNTVYAVVDNQLHREKEPKEATEDLKSEDFEKMDKATFLKLEDKKLDSYLKDQNFPKKYTSVSLKKKIETNEIKLIDIAKYTKNANDDLFDTPVIGAQVYRSDDGGRTWQKTHKNYIDDLYYSYGYYFGKVHVNPKNKEKIYIYGVPILSSDDGGKTFSSIGKDNVHADHHALWINPNASGHLINGNDGGVNITYDDGKSWIKNNHPDVGQFYSVNVDNSKPYKVYGGLQDNGVWVGPSTYSSSVSWHQNGTYPYQSMMGGDGMQVEIDNRNDSIVYTGFQFGYYYRINTITDTSESILPKHEIGESPFRFNWQTPIELSVHNQDILYLGSNKLHRSMHRGDDFVAISGDLTKGAKKGNVPFGTLSSISESPLQFGVIYTGSDDGLVYVTKDGGVNWTNISSTFPQDLWVSRVIASQHKKERVFVTLNGYRNDDFKPYVFVSDDYGSTWKTIQNGLPNASVNVIKEDIENENLLFLGNDQGVFVSFDRGENWSVLENALPTVAVHDLVIQNEAKDLVIGTHGRSIYKTNIAALQEYPKFKDKNLEILAVEDAKYSDRWGTSRSAWLEPNEPKLDIPFYTLNAGKKTIEIKTDKGIIVNSFEVLTERGFNFESYDLTFSENGLKTFLKKNKEVKIEKKKNTKYYLPKGKYFIVIEGEKKEFQIN